MECFTSNINLSISKLIPISVSALSCPLVWSQVRPPNLSPDNLPDTAFTCEDKVTGGYYADVEADCQLFHVCVQVSEFEVSFTSFRKFFEFSYIHVLKSLT